MPDINLGSTFFEDANIGQFGSVNIGDVSLKMLNDWFSTAGGSLNLKLGL